MSTTAQHTSKQDLYHSVYRGRHTWLHHLSYMRVSKVMALLQMVKVHDIDLSNKAVFDYGFGAGTFFLHCPRTSALYGVELDAVNVDAVRSTLFEKGYSCAELAAGDECAWREHPLLSRQYDVIVISHVLEHLKEPEALLEKLMACLTDDGCLLGAVPINEPVRHDSHECTVDRDTVELWADRAEATLVDYVELDYATRWVLPVFELKGSFGRVAAQGLSLGLGLAATAFGRRAWFALTQAAGQLVGAKPGQAVFLMRRC